MLGQKVRVLVEKTSDRHAHMLIGSADNTRLVQFIADPVLIGQFVDIEVTDILSMNLVQGSLIQVESAH